ncbi:hypothetical protein [Candidatus Nitrospira salsa]
MDVPAQNVITKDNVSIKVTAVEYFRVGDAQHAIIEIEPVGYLNAGTNYASECLGTKSA